MRGCRPPNCTYLPSPILYTYHYVEVSLCFIACRYPPPTNPLLLSSPHHEYVYIPNIIPSSCLKGHPVPEVSAVPKIAAPDGPSIVFEFHGANDRPVGGTATPHADTDGLTDDDDADGDDEGEDEGGEEEVDADAKDHRGLQQEGFSATSLSLPNGKPFQMSDI
jgi:hypothetical protein